MRSLLVTRRNRGRKAAGFLLKRSLLAYKGKTGNRTLAADWTESSWSMRALEPWGAFMGWGLRMVTPSLFTRRLLLFCNGGW